MKELKLYLSYRGIDVKISHRRRYPGATFTWLGYFKTDTGECVDFPMRDPFQCINPPKKVLRQEIDAFLDGKI